MLELLKSLAVAVLMVPVVMALMLGMIYGLGEVFNIFSKVGHREKSSARSHINFCHARHPGGRRHFCNAPIQPSLTPADNLLNLPDIALYYPLHNE